MLTKLIPGAWGGSNCHNLLFFIPIQPARGIAKYLYYKERDQKRLGNIVEQSYSFHTRSISSITMHALDSLCIWTFLFQFSNFLCFLPSHFIRLDFCLIDFRPNLVKTFGYTFDVNCRNIVTLRCFNMVNVIRINNIFVNLKRLRVITFLFVKYS